MNFCLYEWFVLLCQLQNTVSQATPQYKFQLLYITMYPTSGNEIKAWRTELKHLFPNEKFPYHCNIKVKQIKHVTCLKVSTKKKTLPPLHSGSLGSHNFKEWILLPDCEITESTVLVNMNTIFITWLKR